MNFLIVFIGKLIFYFSNLFHLGHGSTWPGHIALKLNRNFNQQLINSSKTKIIFVTGTNGKTTTVKLLQTILEKNKKKVFFNHSGANLTNGVASSIIRNSNFFGNLNYDFAIFEIDENSLPVIIKQVKPDILIALNLFRDQLDRYGEVNTVVNKWKNVYSNLKNTTFILNADDPQIAYLGNGLKAKIKYFGINDNKLSTKNNQQAADSILCPKCNYRLNFEPLYFSHLGVWNCSNCDLKRPPLDLARSNFYPLIGTYAIYDTLAAFLTALQLGLTQDKIEEALTTFQPAFGRQEKIIYKDKTVQIFLSKNPTSFNESLKTIIDSKPSNILVVLNDRIPDGTDISWIWDVDFEHLLNKQVNLYLAGDRSFDLALRIKYASYDNSNFKVFDSLGEAIKQSLINTKLKETLYILPNYSAMLETRKILTGRKML